MRSYVGAQLSYRQSLQISRCETFCFTQEVLTRCLCYFHSFEALVNNNALRNLQAKRLKRGKMLMLLSNAGELGNLRGPETHSLIVIGRGYF